MNNFQDNAGRGASKNIPDNVHRFSQIVQVIGTNVQKILQNTSSMQRMLKHIEPSQEHHQLHAQLHQIQHYTTQLAQDTSRSLKEINDYDLNETIPSSISTIEQRNRRLQRKKLTNDFTKAVNGFSTAQRLASLKRKERDKKAKCSGSSGVATPSENVSSFRDDQDENVPLRVMKKMDLE